MKRRFVLPINFGMDQPTQGTSKNEVLSFEDYKNVLSVAWVGTGGLGADVEIRTENGKEILVDSVPVEYLKLGSNREEFDMNTILANNSLRVKTVFETNAAVKGSLVFTLEK